MCVGAGTVGELSGLVRISVMLWGFINKDEPYLYGEMVYVPAALLRNSGGIFAQCQSHSCARMSEVVRKSRNGLPHSTQVAVICL